MSADQAHGTMGLLKRKQDEFGTAHVVLNASKLLSSAPPYVFFFVRVRWGVCVDLSARLPTIPPLKLPQAAREAFSQGRQRIAQSCFSLNESAPTLVFRQPGLDARLELWRGLNVGGSQRGARERVDAAALQQLNGCRAVNILQCKGERRGGGVRGCVLKHAMKTERTGPPWLMATGSCMSVAMIASGESHQGGRRGS